MNKVLPFLLLLFVFTSCSRKYKIEGASSVTSLDGKMLFIKVLQNGEWLNIDSAEVVHGLFSTTKVQRIRMQMKHFINI